MANTGFQGVDVRYSGGGKLLIEDSLEDANGVDVTSGTTNIYLYEEQDDGTLKSYDWNDGTFKSVTVGLEIQTATHRPGNAGARNTGIWNRVISNPNIAGGFTVGGMYVQIMENAGAGLRKKRRWQYGGSEGDDMLFARKLMRADWVTDTTTTPWSIVAYEEGTNNELVRKRMRDVTGANITNTNTVIGTAKQV